MDEKVEHAFEKRFKRTMKMDKSKKMKKIEAERPHEHTLSILRSSKHQRNFQKGKKVVDQRKHCEDQEDRRK